MTFTRALSTNNYGPAKFIVATSAANGTHTTLASAMSAASVGDTIFLRDSVTENVTITPGVNIASWAAGPLNMPTITGKLTMTGAGTSTITGVKLQTNADFFLAVTGSAASIITLDNCYINVTNNVGITFTTSSSSAVITIKDSTIDLANALFASSSAGIMYINSCRVNTASATASTISAGQVAIFNAQFLNPITTSGTSAIVIDNSRFVTGTNTTQLIIGGNGASGNRIYNSSFSSGTATCITATTTLEIYSSVVDSTNANAIDGAGTLIFSGLSFANTSSNISTTTQTGRVFRPGITRSTQQPAFLGYLPSNDLNVTGNVSTYTIGGVTALTEVFDQNSDFNTNGTFTAPVTGRYFLSGNVQFQQATTATDINITINTSNRTFPGNRLVNTIANLILNATSLCDMDAADTSTVTCAASGVGADTVDVIGNGTNAITRFSGFLMA